MRVTPEERDSIVDRLAEIKADLNAKSEPPCPEATSDEEKLDRETTKLLCELADDHAATPAWRKR